jgi:hypothetical protein
MARAFVASPATVMIGPTVVDAALRIKAQSFLIDGEAVIGYLV